MEIMMSEEEEISNGRALLYAAGISVITFVLFSFLPNSEQVTASRHCENIGLPKTSSFMTQTGSIGGVPIFTEFSTTSYLYECDDGTYERK